MRRVYLSLTGGLGNQLFQVVAALAIAKGEEVVVEWVNLRPRQNSKQQCEIADFTLPENVTFQNRHKFQLLSSKSVGYLLRMGVNPRSYEKYRPFQLVTSCLASLLNVRTFGRYVSVGLNRGVGYFPEVNRKRSGSLHLVGYFQTYRWFAELDQNRMLSQMKARKQSDALKSLVALAKLEDPLVVHMRFGDYRLENSFGLLTPTYYRESVRELWLSGNYKSIWVFSDEIEAAKNYLRDIDVNEIRYISNVANSATQTLEAMRLGKGYVIGNSSFSWWAARLSHNLDAKVIAPTPWFVGQNEPVDLIPPNWMRKRGH